MSSNGWIGVDLDGTLAEYNGWKGIQHIGAPVPDIVERVKQVLDVGYTVKIFTARVYGHTGAELQAVVAPIFAWCQQHIGQALDVTCVKDFAMIELWDDRCVQVEQNTGKFLGRSQIIR